jgi:hypothetical protein
VLIHEYKFSDTRFPGKQPVIAEIHQHLDGNFSFRVWVKFGRELSHGFHGNLEVVREKVQQCAKRHWSEEAVKESVRPSKPDVATDAGLAELKALAVDVDRSASSSSDEEKLARGVHALIDELRRVKRNKAHDEKIYVSRVAKLLFLRRDASNTETDWNCLPDAVIEKWKEEAAEFLGIGYAPTKDVLERFLPLG